MTEKSKQIFADREKLREKLGIYLQTPEKVEIYAQAAEKMFAKTGGSSIGFAATWSWWGFFFGSGLFLYRKLYLLVVVIFAIGMALSFITPDTAKALPWIFGAFVAIVAKYFIIKDFEKKLDLSLSSGNDEVLKMGVMPIYLVILVFVAFTALTFVLTIWGGGGILSEFTKFSPSIYGIGK